MAKHEPDPTGNDYLDFDIVATWPVGTFLENIAVREDGIILVTSLSDATVHSVDKSGKARLFAKLPQPVTGIVVSGSETFVCSGAVGKNPWKVFRIDSEGRHSLLVEIPEALLLNGFTPFRGRTALAVDSYLGAIFEVNLDDRRYQMWLQHELLGKRSDREVMPGVNGIKCFQNAVFVTNTDSERLIKVEVVENGAAGAPIVLEENLVGDDFAFDSTGALYVATHSQNGIMKLSSTGQRRTIAGPRQGMVGATACTFGNTEEDRKTLYVTTTGGIVSPFEGRLQLAKLVRLEVGVEGHPISFT